MSELFMIGCDHRRVSPSGLEAVAGDRASRIAELLTAKAAGRIRGAVFLSTCNRVELLVDADEPEVARRLLTPTGDGHAAIEGALVQVAGRDAIARLLRIATGLESMVVGETQILGQVTRAFKAAEDVGLLSKPLHMLRTRVASTARRLRLELPATRPVGSVAALGVEALLGAGPRIGVIGAGETAQLALELLQRRKRTQDVVVINRTLARAEALANHFDCAAMPLDEFVRGTPTVRAGRFDALLCAVDSPRPFVRETHAASLDVLVDLSRPSVCHDEVKQLAHLDFVDLDVLAQRTAANEIAQSAAAVAMATHVEARVDTIWDQLHPSRSSLAGVVELHLESALAEVEQAFRGKLRDLDESHRDSVRELVRRIAKRDAHYHMLDLKQLGLERAEGGAGATASRGVPG